MWAALSSSGIIGPFFFEAEGETETVNSDRYLKLRLKNKFLPALQRKGVHIADVWFQQDGAAPHAAQVVLSWLEKTFGDRFISFKTEKVWPPHSPDLNPLDFFLWVYLKEKVYIPKPETLVELKSAIRRGESYLT